MLRIAPLIIRDLAVVGTAGGEFGEIGRSGTGLDGEQIRAIRTSLAYDPPRASGYLDRSYRCRTAARSVERALHGPKRSGPLDHAIQRQRCLSLLSMVLKMKSTSTRSGIHPLSEPNQGGEDEAACRWNVRRAHCCMDVRRRNTRVAESICIGGAGRFWTRHRDRAGVSVR